MCLFLGTFQGCERSIGRRSLGKYIAANLLFCIQSSSCGRMKLEKVIERAEYKQYHSVGDKIFDAVFFRSSIANKTAGPACNYL